MRKGLLIRRHLSECPLRPLMRVQSEWCPSVPPPWECATRRLSHICFHFDASHLPMSARTEPESESDPQACTEDQVKAMLARSPVGAKLSRWVSCGKGSVAAVRRASGTVSQACTRARPRMQALTLTASPNRLQYTLHCAVSVLVIKVGERSWVLLFFNGGFIFVSDYVRM